ncbi:MAG: carboxymethylenebutenolidase [Candidatus Poriferisodalaceae bacterium]|jgi:carboxymethylenebutenolidase
MIEANTHITTADGSMNTFITRPEDDGPHPVVLFLMDAPGKREELHDMARRIATCGYHVMLPNLYYRDTRGFAVHREDPASIEQMFSYMANLTNAMVAEDCAALMAHAATDPTADPSKVGVTGYCMSGPFALWTAAEFPDVVKAAASIHGVRLAVDAEDSPHARAAEMAGEILVMAAEHDAYVDRPHFDRLEAALAGADVTRRMEWIDAVHHGFVFPQRPAFDKPAAELHWELLLGMFQRTLR